MDEIILGLPGPWADDNHEVADLYTTKIGGLPDWPFSNFTMQPGLLECGACKSSLCLLAQVLICCNSLIFSLLWFTCSLTTRFLILFHWKLLLLPKVYAPISTKSLTSEERTLYVFGCVMPKCGSDPSSWKAVRVQKSFSSDEPNLPHDEVAPLPSSSLSAPKDWREDLWTFDPKEDDDESNDSIDLEELGRALSEAATISSNTKEQKRESETALKPSLVAYKARSVDKTPVLPCFYIYTQQEKTLKEVSSACSRPNAVSTNGNGSYHEDHASEEKWEEESYEYDRALSADRTYLKFKKRMDAYPEQCIRYCYAGKPLLASLEERDCGNCSLCGAPRHFELQLMPPLLYFLQEASIVQEKLSLENWNWMTMIVYTCSKSCSHSTHQENSGNGAWIVAEEAVIVQYE